jgi:hypothetical protein
MIRQFCEVLGIALLWAVISAMASASDCPNGQCPPRPSVRVRVVTPAVRVDVRTRPAAVRVRVGRPIRGWFIFFPGME